MAEQLTTAAKQAVIIEIRAGAGGEEAALFANDLYRMYAKYAENRNWLVRLLDSNPTGLGGLKQITFEIKGEEVFDKLKNEAGVHRVQRVPKTEKSNRLHTSTASVAVLKKPEQAEVKINPQDLKFDFYKASGHGGQNVNKRQTAIRITHLPTGLIVSSQTQRNLEQNRAAALSILEAKLLNQQKNKIENEIREERRGQIGSQDRSEKIRTYNFPQDRITDHRLNKKFYNLEKIMEGRLDKILNK